MLRGKKTFKCDNCGHTFKAFDIELAATVYSQPSLLWRKGHTGRFGNKWRINNEKQTVVEYLDKK